MNTVLRFIMKYIPVMTDILILHHVITSTPAQLNEFLLSYMDYKNLRDDNVCLLFHTEFGERDDIRIANVFINGM